MGKTVIVPHPASVVAEAFLEAIVWGEHLVVWQLLSTDGRNHVLAAGSRGGLDSVLAERIRQGTSSEAEMDDFLYGLVRGLRVDLSGADLDQIELGPDTISNADNSVSVLLHTPAVFHEEPWLVGMINLSSVGDAWLVDRLDPRRIKS